MQDTLKHLLITYLLPQSPTTYTLDKETSTSHWSVMSRNSTLAQELRGTELKTTVRTPGWSCAGCYLHFSLVAHDLVGFTSPLLPRVLGGELPEQGEPSENERDLQGISEDHLDDDGF